MFLVEDNCDAVGSTHQGQLTGTFGHFATVSFYPAHHITTGEGGCVLTNDMKLARLVEQLRDWGRDCWCEPDRTTPVSSASVTSSERFRKATITSTFFRDWL